MIYIQFDDWFNLISLIQGSSGIIAGPIGIRLSYVNPIRKMKCLWNAFITFVSPFRLWIYIQPKLSYHSVIITLRFFSALLLRLVALLVLFWAVIPLLILLFHIMHDHIMHEPYRLIIIMIMITIIMGRFRPMATSIIFITQPTILLKTTFIMT